MRTRSYLLPMAATAAAAWLLAPPHARGFVTHGGSLGLSQRDVRVFDNFTDVTANDNTAPDPSFPGYTGVELAAWKAVVEWGSELHGSGNGDAHQPGGLGSGGANFDASWQGNAYEVGGVDDNVISEITSTSLGVLGFVEFPDTNGWRARLLSVWNWQDDPGVYGGTIQQAADLQGVICSLYGNALGLSTSTVPGATMAQFTDNGVSRRSLEPDDIAGVQAIYGVKSAAKPRITSVAVAAGIATIDGANFAATDNEVWFTQLGIAGDGTPVKLLGVASTNGGTRITVAVPSAAGDGDVLVRGAGSSGASLSNAWPIDTSNTPPPVVTDIASVTPASLQSVTADPIPFVITGSALHDVNSVRINGVVVSSFTQTYSTIAIAAWPGPYPIGAATISVSGPHGSDSATIPVGVCEPPVLDMTPSLPSSFTNGGSVTFTAGSEVGDIVYVVASTSPTPTTLPGVLDIAIGAGLSDLIVLKTLVVPAIGFAQYSAVVTGLPAGVTIYTEALAFPNELGSDLVEDSDPPQSVLVLF